MYEILVGTILATAAGFLFLTLLIVVNKAWRDHSQRRDTARRQALEPRVLDYVQGEAGTILEALGERPQGADRPVVEAILLDHRGRHGEVEDERLARALDELGYVDEYLAALESGSWWRRASTAEKLGLAGSRRAIDALSRAMEDRNAEVRLRAR